MTSRFAGFPKQMQTFFRALEKNNSREWFTPRKQIYEEQVRRPMIELTGLINQSLRAFAVDNVVADPSRAIYRIYRDTRFSKDKTPYKTHVGATFPRSGLPKHAGAGFYFGISHKQVEVAGGVYMPGPEELATLRSAIAHDPASFIKLVENRALLKQVGPLVGDALKRMPGKWADREQAPEAKYLRMKQFYHYAILPADAALAGSIAREIVKRFKAMASVVDWFNDTLLAARAGAREETRPKRPEAMW